MGRLKREKQIEEGKRGEKERGEKRGVGEEGVPVCLVFEYSYILS